jgi:hypothetical protein
MDDIRLTAALVVILKYAAHSGDAMNASQVWITTMAQA